MPDKMILTVTLRREVPDKDTARQIYDLVKVKLADRPDIKVTGHASNHFDMEGPE